MPEGLAKFIVRRNGNVVIVRDGTLLAQVVHNLGHAFSRELGTVREVIDLSYARVNCLRVALIRNARSTVHDERGIGTLANLGQRIEVQVRRTLVESMGSAKGNGKDVDSSMTRPIRAR